VAPRSARVGNDACRLENAWNYKTHRGMVMHVGRGWQNSMRYSTPARAWTGDRFDTQLLKRIQEVSRLKAVARA